MLKTRLVCVLILFGIVPAREVLLAQERTGTITGTVSDAGHYVLPGARIEPDPKAATIVSDQQGRFTIANLPAGDYGITVSYVGPLPYTQQLTVSAGESVRVDAVLQVAGVKEEASYSIARQLQLVVALLNLNNEVFGLYQGSPQYPIQREFYNRTVSIGIRLTK